MSQRPPEEDIRLSEDEIRAMGQNLRRQYIRDEGRSMVGSAASVVVGGVESAVRRVLILLRLPLILLAVLAGFLLITGREGVTFFGAVGAGVLAGIVAAAILEAAVRFIDARAYRREVG